METHQEELPSLMNTLNMNFKFWPSLLLVMDQTVLLFSGKQWKMVGTVNSLTNILINSIIVVVEIRVILLIDSSCYHSNVDSRLK